MSDRRNPSTGEPLIVYCYRQISDASVFRDLVYERFRRTGHTCEIEFRFWDCYKQPPGRDGDLYIYDGMTLSALADKGYIRRLPDIIDTSGVFEWVLNGSRVRQQIFGIPFMLCSNVLICRKSDYVPIDRLTEGQIAAPMKSLIGEYYVFSYFNSPHRDEGSLRTLKRLRALIGGPDAYEHSRFAEYDGIERFIRGDCKALLGFTEDLRYLPPDEYIVLPANISDSVMVELPFQYVNYISVGSGVNGERLLDCLDMIEIITDSGFFIDYCTADGQLRYLLPANKNLYAGLAALDSLYTQLFAIVNDENNCVLRYGKHFYEEFQRKSAELHAMLADGDDRRPCEDMKKAGVSFRPLQRYSDLTAKEQDHHVQSSRHQSQRIHASRDAFPSRLRLVVAFLYGPGRGNRRGQAVLYRAFRVQSRAGGG